MSVTVSHWPGTCNLAQHNASGQWEKILLINGKDQMVAFNNAQRNGVTEDAHLSALLGLRGCEVPSAL